ncbi:MAG: tail fiber domain-containing protein [Bacteroidota bacterium]
MLLVFLLSLTATTTLCQGPALFSYQAVIRDNNNLPLSDQEIDLKFSILTDSPTGSAVFREIQTATSDENGLICVMIGSGTPLLGSLDMIPWGEHTFYLKVEVDQLTGSGYTDMGTNLLLSVPYAMHADKVAMPLENLIVTETVNQQPDEALFEVKRKDGSTVFAVYEEGVRVFISDEEMEKGVKGGFAVGGYSKTGKGYTKEYLRVTPDSVRIYIDEPAQKGVKGGFAVGGYNKTKNGAIQYLQLDPLNYFIGHEAGFNNNGGEFNSFIGYQAGYSNSTGHFNLFHGYKSGFSNTTGEANVFIGQEAGFSNTTGQVNSFVGHQAGYKSTTGKYNTFLGFWSGYYNETGELNTFVGAHAGFRSTEGQLNTVIGAYAASEGNLGGENTLIGMGAGTYCKGNFNTYLGAQAGYANENGNANIILGFYAGELSTGSDNLFIGNSAGRNSLASNSIFIGNGTGNNIKRSNTLIIDGLWDADSANALIYGETDNRVLRFNGKVGVGTHPLHNSTFSVAEKESSASITIRGVNDGYDFAKLIFASDGQDQERSYVMTHNKENAFYLMYFDGENYFPRLRVDTQGNLVLNNWFDGTQQLDVTGNARFREVGSATAANDLRITADGTLTTSTSDARLKTNLVAIDGALEKIRSMQGYRFNWKSGSDGKPDVGFLAQDMQQIFPEAVFENPADGYLGINYSRLPVLLVEAVKEQQRIIEEKESEISELKNRIERLEKLLGVE